MNCKNCRTEFIQKTANYLYCSPQCCKEYRKNSIRTYMNQKYNLIKDDQDFIQKRKDKTRTKEWNMKVSKYQKDRKAKDPLYKLKCNIRSLVSTIMRQGGYSKRSKTFNILGCSPEDFKLHIQNKFSEDMNWENYGLWQYDHIIPVSSATCEEDLIKLNHYTNFQPLWELDNKRKGNRLT